ncbi:MAG: hypothetical protein ACK5LJ_07510, partial [Paracoccus sp. (in: a-proteobacteria)]
MSIDADISFIPRAEQKVNLPVAVTGRAVQHIVNDHLLKAGGFGLRLKAGSVRHAADSRDVKVVVRLRQRL